MSSTRRRSLAGYALVAAAASSWGTWPAVLHVTHRFGAVSPLAQSLALMSVLVVVTTPFTVRDRVRRRATAREWAGIAWLGVGDLLNVLLFFAAYASTSVAIAVLTHYLTPIFVALAAPRVLRERAHARTYVAVALSFVGLVVLLEPWRASRHAHDLVGALYGAGSAVFYAANVLVTKRLGGAFSGSELTAYHAMVSVAILAVAAAVLGVHAAPAALAVFSLFAVGPGALAALFFVWGLRRIPASHASNLTLLEPLIAVVLAGALLGEPPSVAAAAGGALILVGAAIVMSKPGSA